MLLHYILILKKFPSKQLLILNFYLQDKNFLKDELGKLIIEIYKLNVEILLAETNIKNFDNDYIDEVI